MDMDTQSGPGMKARLGSFILQSKRVWHVLKKPSSEEFKAVAKISALGILALGALGFLISLIMSMIL